MRWKRTGAEGFTLIEVILVIVITAITIPVLVFILGQQARSTVGSEKIINAAGLAQALQEEIRSAGYAQADTYDGYSDSKTLGKVQYTRSVSVCNVDSSDLDTCAGSNTGFKRIGVTVSTADLGDTTVVTLLTDY
ncbi:MAG: type II secretion system protein [Nitrospirota bacterium]|jgi:prepilin-type N-terminal cleavage/methylation domain-containing protein